MLIAMSNHCRIYLNPQQRQHLESLIRSGNAPARVQTRARILLLSDRNHEARLTNEAIAQALMCSPGTVRNVRKRCCAAAPSQTEGADTHAPDTHAPDTVDTAALDTAALDTAALKRV
jgi:hypothetical protein